MFKNQYKVIGVMSGTSLDGIDIAYLSFSLNKGYWNFEILKSQTIPYNDFWLNTLSSLTDCSSKRLNEINKDYTKLLAEVIFDFTKDHDIKDLDIISSHGHTALHNPDAGYTIQIGNRHELTETINIPIVCDFRVQDVNLGGQGAPLVPIGDRLLFSEFDYCLNLGGFANISTEVEGDRIAYDICPVNIVLNHYTRKLDLDYDDKGIIASKGKINTSLLEALNNLNFYNLQPPKSLGLEWVQTEVFPIIDSFDIEIKDILRTFIEHISYQIAKHIKRISKVLVTGGGAYNEFLIERLRSISKSNLILPSKELIEYKEALIFGLLGVLKLRDEVNCLKSVTGAIKDHSSGVVYNI